MPIGPPVAVGDHLRRPQGLMITLITGEPGAGKTTLALRIGRQQARRGITVGYVDFETTNFMLFRSLFRDGMLYFRTDEVDGVLSLLSTYPCLILDSPRATAIPADTLLALYRKLSTHEAHVIIADNRAPRTLEFCASRWLHVTKDRYTIRVNVKKDRSSERGPEFHVPVGVLV